MPPAQKTSSAKQEKTPSFEQAMEELESMVETMESGQLPLEELIKNYERGAALIRHCESVLDEARERLELVTLQPSAVDAAGTTQEDTNEGTSNDNHDDEIRLF